MATPITWQNINAPSFGEANRLMGSAQQSILGAFDGAKTVLADSQAFDKELWKRQDQEATQDVLGKIYQAQNVDQFKTLNQSGALDQAVAANGAVIDRAAVNALRDGRISTLQKREVEGIGYRDTMLNDAQAADVRRINTLALTDPVAAKAELAKNPDLLKSFEIAKNIDASSQTLVERAWAKERFGFEQSKEAREKAAEDQRAIVRPYEAAVAKLEPEAKRAQIRNSNASADASVARAAADRDAVNFRAQERLEQRLTATNAKIAELADSTKTLGSAGGQESVIKAITANIKDESTRARLVATLPGLLSKPEFASAPAGVVATALLSDVNTNLWDSSGNNVASKLTQLLKNTSSGQSKDIEDSLTVLRQQRDVLRKELGYGGGDSAAPAPAPGPSPTSAPAPEPSKPAPTNEAPPSVFNAAQETELVRQRAELEKGVRKAFSPEMQTLLERDKVQGQAFQATVAKRKADEETALNKRREELSRSLGIEVVAKPAPWTPSNAGWAPATSPRFGSQINNLQAFVERQKRYENWVQAMDDRLGAEAKKAK